MSFRITVKEDCQEIWWFPPGERKPKTARIRIDPLDLRTVQMLGALLADGLIRKRSELEILGSLLYRMLFDYDMDKAFVAVKEKAQKTKTALRVVLEFELRTDSLALLPWEYLHRPEPEGGAGVFLAAAEYLVLSRYVSIKKPWADWDGQEGVRILIVISRPRDRDIVRTGSALDYLMALEKDSDGRIVIETLDQPSKKSFEEALGKDPHIVHFIGHGRFQDNSGFISFVDAAGKSSDISDADFASCFENRDSRLVFLEVCEGAASDSYTAFSGTALRLVHYRLPAVIAMRYEISNEAANAFSLRFYQELRSRKPIDKAVQAARSELGKYLEDQNFSSREFGCPVLFLQAEEDMDAKGVIPFPQTVESGRSEPEMGIEEPRPDPQKAYLCPRPRCYTELNIRNRCCSACGSDWRLHSCGEPYLLTSKFCSVCKKPIARLVVAPTGSAAAPSSMVPGPGDGPKQGWH